MLWLLPVVLFAGPPAPRTRNVVLIVSDGLRWQEVFHGPDPALMTEACGGVEEPEALARDFRRPSAEEGRRTLLPFFWNVVAKDGQLFGNQTEGSLAHDTNGQDFSYPGYNEMLSGAPDARIDSNDPNPNPNLTVFEWLSEQPGLEGRVEAYATWSVFDAIFNKARSGLKVCSGWRPANGCLDASGPMLTRVFETSTQFWTDNVWDAFLQAAVLDEVRRNHPRVLFVGYGETDDWAHLGRYDLLLRSAHAMDRFVAELWEAMQAMPEYKDQTTFVITTDHGRGDGPENWKHHDWNVDGAENMWIAVLGPDTPALGERKNAARVTQSQIAATVAALFGKDWRAFAPKAGAPLAEALRPTP